jgi:hypothetical protein
MHACRVAPAAVKGGRCAACAGNGPNRYVKGQSASTMAEEEALAMDMNGTGSTLGQDDFEKRNRDSIIRVALMVAIALVLASTTPANLMMAVFSGLLFISAVVAAVFAMLMRDRPFAHHFTRWDETAALLGLSIATGLMVDPAMLEQAIQQQQQTLAPTVSQGSDG